jgi:hypothetical protein
VELAIKSESAVEPRTRAKSDAMIFILPRLRNMLARAVWRKLGHDQKAGRSANAGILFQAL